MLPAYNLTVKACILLWLDLETLQISLNFVSNYGDTYTPDGK